jgi:hypothetical protein
VLREKREADPNWSTPAIRQKEIWEIKTPGANARQSERGRRRTRQGQISLWGFGPSEIAELEETRTERRKLVSSAGPALKERTLPKYDPAV